VVGLCVGHDSLFLQVQYCFHHGTSCKRSCLST
jgi:uncharacterized metal-binding protein